MSNSRILRMVAFLALAGVLSGCYQLVYRRQDENDLRRQLHVPSDVRAVSLDGYPKSASFFGREGLQIHAVFEFERDQFERYVATMNDGAEWKPEPLVAYAPDRAEEYSEASMRWQELPVPDWTQTRLRHWPSLPEVRRIERGRVYCSSIALVRGERVEHADGGHHDAAKYLGRSCSEVEQLGAPSIVTIFGVVDFDTRRLHAHIAFSG